MKEKSSISSSSRLFWTTSTQVCQSKKSDTSLTRSTRTRVELFQWKRSKSRWIAIVLSLIGGADSKRRTLWRKKTMKSKWATHWPKKPKNVSKDCIECWAIRRFPWGEPSKPTIRREWEISPSSVSRICWVDSTLHFQTRTFQLFLTLSIPTVPKL